ncbi:hypothetical protein SASPL_154528 [Salvia splendens]|uniref:F-box associated domain-containing protein n=1 Tax=Salvia splendens TaxID=180675 RepID=A0A8X8YYT6_SALSN|nr:hypothetical protein SASPL_154528 [Salvia splendens]
MLSALEFYTCEPDSYPRPFNFQLWVMSDGSWTRESVFHIRRIREPLLFSEDGRLLYLTFLGEYKQELVVFDRANGKLKHLGIASHVDDPAMFPFVESFVQLNGISCIEEVLVVRLEEKDNMDKLCFVSMAVIVINRDLSMILVLVDIINKNGLQMLHNIMKRYRKEFIKTPILRKLLKVLEYLATREILTLEHISKRSTSSWCRKLLRFNVNPDRTC